MKKGLKITLYAAAICAILAILAILFRLNEGKHSQLACTGVRIEFADDYRFVTQEDIEGYLKSDFGPFIGKRLDSLDLEKAEKILSSKSSVMKADAYTTPDGYLNIRIWQREPVIKFQKRDIGFYADEKGFLFPLQGSYNSKVPVMEGDVPLSFENGYKGEPKTEAEKEWLAKAINLATYISSSEKWNEAVSKMTVNGDGEVEMALFDGSEKFIFGKPDDIAEKFGRIQEYYTSILPAKGRYRSVNVKFRGQIVCREKIN